MLDWWLLALVAIDASSLWVLIELGFRRGTDGENDYGPDPLQDPRSRRSPRDH